MPWGIVTLSVFAGAVVVTAVVAAGPRQIRRRERA